MSARCAPSSAVVVVSLIRPAKVPDSQFFYTDLSMSYAAAIDQLNAMVPELYTQGGQPRRKFSLEEIGVLLSALGDPHRRFPSVRSEERRVGKECRSRWSPYH